MNRWTSISLGVVVLLLSPVQFQAQQASGGVQGSESAYPDSSEGLQKMLQDTIEAVRSKDAAKEAALIGTLIMPEDSTWFRDKFGPAFGPLLATAYQKTRSSLEQEIQPVYEGNAQRGWSQPKILRYADAATVDSPIDNFLNCMDVVVPLYQTAFSGDRTRYQMAPRSDEPGRSKVVAGDLPGYYVYAKGSFRFVPQEIFLMLPKERPIRIQLDMNVMRSKITNNYWEINNETIKKVMNLRTKSKVVIHFVLDTNGKIKEINAVEGPSNLREPFLQAVKQWSFEPTKLDGEPVEVEVNYETGGQIQRRILIGLIYRSTAIATAFPPPKHSAAIPRCTSRRIIS
jgi:hypothetical protein